VCLTNIDFSGSHCLDLMPSQQTDPTKEKGGENYQRVDQTILQ
jgi:hypothetical protein